MGGLRGIALGEITNVDDRVIDAATMAPQNLKYNKQTLKINK